MRIVFLGSGEFGLATLNRLAREHDVRAIVTQPDRPAGRKQRLTATPVGAWAAEEAASIPLIKPENVNEAEVMRAVRGFEADAWVVIAFGQKLGQDLLRDRVAMNLHASLLPRWRGAAPINHAILAGDVETGNSVITVVERMDAGDVLGRTHRAIDSLMTAGELHDALAADGPEAVMGALSRLEAGRLRPEEQDEALVTRAGKLGRGDRWIDFSQPAEMCRRRVHGLTPWPGVGVVMDDGKKRMEAKLMRVQAVEADHEEGAGTLLDAERGVVACARGTAMRVLEAQPAGGRVMAWEELARGRRIAAGARMSSVVAHG